MCLNTFFITFTSVRDSIKDMALHVLNPIYTTMNKVFFLCCLIAFNCNLKAQDSYTIASETFQLKTEIEGTLDLLWTTVDKKYRYFVKDAQENITELKNEKGTDGKYQNQHQTTLKALTGLDASKVRLTLYDLKQFINVYNSTKDTNYKYANTKAQLKSRIGIFGGLTNHRFLENPDAIKTGLLSGEFEIFGLKSMTKHAGFASVRHAFGQDDFDINTTQVALGYRYRFINASRFNVYGQTKFATYTFTTFKQTIASETDPNTFVDIETSGNDFDAPFIFGLGADFKLGNGYLSVVYDSLFALLIDNRDNFPIDISLGYKFNL